MASTSSGASPGPTARPPTLTNGSRFPHRRYTETERGPLMSRFVSEASIGLAPDSRVDQEAGIIRSVKVLGSASRNGRTYPPALLAECYGVYEGSQVYADHDYQQLKSGKARPLGSWGGVLRGASFHNDAIFADLHC